MSCLETKQKTGKIPDRILVEMMLYVNNISKGRMDFDSEHNFYDIILAVFLNELKRSDVYSDYSKQRLITDYNSGRLLVAETVIINKIGKLKYAVERNERTVNNELNRLIKLALCKAYKLTEIYKNELGFWINTFRDIETLNNYEHNVLHDCEAKYRRLISLAKLLIKLEELKSSLDEQSHSVETTVEWFIWQEFVGTYISRNTSWTVERQLNIRVNKYINIRPDFVVKHLNREVVIETKNYCIFELNQGHVYQIHYYVTKNSIQCEKGCLVYSGDEYIYEKIDNNPDIFRAVINVQNGFEQVLKDMGNFVKELLL